MDSRPLLLSGPSGVGKSTIAARVAAALGRPFVDLDREIERALGASPAVVFERLGEPAFRAEERAQLRVALARTDAPVVALGGGALADPASLGAALDSATVVTLTATVETLAARLAGTEDRPLVGADDTARASRIAALLEARRAAYAAGAAKIDVTALDVDDVTARVVAIARDAFVRQGDGAFVRFTSDAFAATEAAVRGADAARVFVVTDEMVLPLYGERMVKQLDGCPRPIVVASGEVAKSLTTIGAIAGRLAAEGADRRALIVALGGGVVTDVAGFAASTFMRGVRWIAVPTTTLGMVDAAIGGKTGVDLDVRKNLVGAFHMPLTTIVDPSLALTESPRARASGFAEVIKSLAVGDAEAFAALEAASPTAWRDAVRRGAAVKARVVREDPTELGVRVVLNFGHTFGHALEAFGGLARWTHGEAVSLGMVAAVRLGVRLGVTPPRTRDRVIDALARAGLPVSLALEDVAGAAVFLRADKKRDGDAVRFVLLEDIGRCVVQRLPFGELERLIPHVCG